MQKLLSLLISCYMNIKRLYSTDIQLYSMVTNIVPAVAIVGDVDGNGIVNGADLGILLAVWGPITCGSVYDLTGDCMVDGFDLATLLSNWG